VRRVLVTVTEGEGLHAAREARPLQTLLMMAASHAARTEYAPGERPYLVSRSGAAGMQRYAATSPMLTQAASVNASGRPIQMLPSDWSLRAASISARKGEWPAVVTDSMVMTLLAGASICA
jgi:hypothetical protein